MSRTIVRRGPRPKRGPTARRQACNCQSSSFQIYRQHLNPVGGGAKPIDHRPERKFGTGNVRIGWKTTRCLHTIPMFHITAVRIYYCNHLFMAYSRANATGGPGARAHRPPSRTEVRHGKRPNWEEDRGAPTHGQRKAQHSRWAGARAHRPPPRAKVGTENVPNGDEYRGVPPALTSKNL